MAQSLARVLVHIVFSTRERRPFLDAPEFLRAAHACLNAICKRHDCPCIAIGGVADHVHLLCVQSRSVALADLLREIKRSSTNWLRQHSPSLKQFAWQAGYGAFSVSSTHRDIVEKYIAHQAEHHRRVSFQAELIRLLRKNGVSYDERYLWD